MSGAKTRGAALSFIIKIVGLLLSHCFPTGACLRPRLSVASDSPSWVSRRDMMYVLSSICKGGCAAGNQVQQECLAKGVRSTP
ncbi:hypothetical protein P175DRAFT_0254112 [Aspergillus ochraceoroseus IBT 24754]|uniref:Secreted protein n=1 Tax=Aspergillus ochraceoroseus IBT 24754 TaxID=1392256 RepID=A0A2T5LU15_9EURO|nr:uncharacterized protein P175DRAFT_0254112 [Aspergillus ochraceoroseus IBT 24754]PTU19763.1 hypothetical protein P175DRAFT_0254112 [Aspergillus ochraceoroseus IBT 24754]